MTYAACDVRQNDPAFGYRFISDELKQTGLKVGENRVWRLCSQQQLWGVFATKPNELWLTDIAEHRTDEGKIYLCTIKDVHSNKIVGYSIDSRMKACLAVAAARNAISQRDVAGTILHSDSGSQLRSNAFVRVLSNLTPRSAPSFGKSGVKHTTNESLFYFVFVGSGMAVDIALHDTANDPGTTADVGFVDDCVEEFKVVRVNSAFPVKTVPRTRK